MVEKISGRILVVDDNIANLHLLVRTLTKVGHIISVAKSGEEAISLIKKNPLDLILLDIMMPGMDGYTTCEIIKNSPDTQETPVIFLSALDDISSKTKGFTAGAVDYISKPFNEKEVIIRVNTHLSLSLAKRELKETIACLSSTKEELQAQNENLQELSKVTQQSEERFRGLTNLLPVAIFETNIAGILTFTNHIGREVFECIEDVDINVCNILEFVVPDERDNATKFLNHIIKGIIQKTGLEITLQKKDGTPFKAIVYMNVIFEKESRVPLGLRGVLFDITERKKIEESLRKSKEKISILSGITRHDLINQIHVLQEYVALLEENTCRDCEKYRYVENIQKCCAKIHKHIVFSKDYQDLGLNSPVWQNIEKSALIAAHNNLPEYITLSINAGNYELFADPMLMLVFYNLFENAVKYGGKITTISVTFTEHDKNGVMMIEDDGIGILLSMKEKIFEKGVGKNTGLGLFLVRQILDLTGLTIKEIGEPGRGCRFKISVPFGSWRKSTGDPE
jgi:PAS domain S-box-containing protein